MHAIIHTEKGDLKVVATGGLSSILTPLASYFDEVNKLITLELMINFILSQKKLNLRSKNNYILGLFSNKISISISKWRGLNLLNSKTFISPSQIENSIGILKGLTK